MAFSKKTSRPIEVDGHNYRWVFFENSGWNDLTVQSANGSGQKLSVSIAWDNEKGSHLPYAPVTPSFVGEAIRFALMSGWIPSENGGAFNCRFKNGNFLNDENC